MPKMHNPARPGKIVADYLQGRTVTEVAANDWLRQVASAYDALKADPKRAISASRVRARLAAEHQKTAS